MLQSAREQTDNKQQRDQAIATGALMSSVYDIIPDDAEELIIALLKIGLPTVSSSDILHPAKKG
jgi:hypothetical protein